MDNFMDKVGCNHLVIAGHLESVNYAKADFLAMHLEQHLQFTIDRHGRVQIQWPEFYESVLVPLEITSDSIKNGDTVVYTRESRVIGHFEAFRTWAQLKYSVNIEYDEERMRAISDVHTKRAQGVIDDSTDASFDAKVDALLQRRADYLEQARQIVAGHQATIVRVRGALNDLADLTPSLSHTSRTCMHCTTTQ
jgi:hypothetical protein